MAQGVALLKKLGEHYSESNGRTAIGKVSLPHYGRRK